MFTKEKFLKYYDFEIDKFEQIWIFKKGNPTNKKGIVKNKEWFMIFTYGNNAKTMDEAQKLINEGVADKVYSYELYKVLLDNITEEELDNIFRGMWKKDLEYIDRLEDEIGFLSMDIDKRCDCINEKIGNIKRNILKEAEVFKCKDGRFCIEYGIFSPPDDYSDVTIYTKKEPKEDFFNKLDFIESETERLRNKYIKDKEIIKLAEEITEKEDDIKHINIEEGNLEYDEEGRNGVPSYYYTVTFNNGESYKWIERNIFDFGTVFNPCFEIIDNESGGMVNREENGEYWFETYTTEHGWTNARKMTESEIKSYDIAKELGRYKGIIRM